MRQDLTVTPLWDHQAEALQQYQEELQMLCAWEMGTGKTLFALARDQIMREQEGISHTLIVAPLSTHRQWAIAIRKETGLTVSVINPKNRRSFLDNKAYYHIMHYEALRLEVDELRDFKFHAAIFDECHRLKNRSTKQTKAAKRLKIPFLTDMSGSPVTDKPQDVWSILNHLKPKDYKSFWRFFHTMVDADREYNPSTRGHYWKSKGPSEAWLTNGLDAIDPFYSRIKIDDCFDIPGIVNTRIDVPLAPGMRKQYNEMKKEMLIWIQELGTGDEVPLAAPAVIAKLTRLQQLAMGTLALDPVSEKYKMTMPAPKIAAIVDLINDNDDQKFLVFSQWRLPLLLLKDQLAKQKGERAVDVAMFTGNETGPLREKSKQEFISGNARVLLATIGAGGEGVDGLQHVCNNVIFLDRSWTPTANDQAIARLRRGGQTKPVNVIDVVSTDTIDQERLTQIELKKKWVLQTLGDI